MGLFFGTLVLAEMFMLSRVPAVLAEWLVDRMKTGRWAMVALCLLSGFISAFVENVAVVLLVAPVALSVSKRLNTSPVPLLIGIAVSSNLQGTATMIGDPPSMIFAGFKQMGFLDFFVYQGRPGIFFAVEIGAVASLLVLFYVFRHERQTVSKVEVERPRSWVPTILLIFLVLALSISTIPDPEFKWFAGAVTLVLALAGTLWFVFGSKWGSFKELFSAIDWDTTLFLIGIFIIVGGLSDAGWLDKLAVWLGNGLGSNTLLAFIVVVAMAVILSAFIDNVPFLLTMLPVVNKIAEQMGGSDTALLYGLLIGACLGGNITPIGASANVVTLGILRKQGHVVSFGKFMSIGVPFTIVAVAAASLFVWFVWGTVL
ncbi:MAG TPA: SLC13 family permease, partial [Paludibacter sp.]|nr:SLC13 family permease [Paludibacter sp.]